ncbi:MAG: radical SAM protein, partial [Oscillospiraceae bacterium]|nr:radical SAM protein [Oscillospiraceae bacterium]
MAEQRANKIPAASPDTAVSPAAALPLGRVHSVETGGTVDGPGIRYVLFLQGCPLRCVYCHNPDTWDCGGGRTMTVDEVVTDIRRYRAFIQNGGVTLSGGEPLLQADFAAAVLDACRREGIHTAVDTSGAVPLAACRHAVDAADLLLLDMKAGTDALCAQITGQDLSRPLELLR